MSQNQNPILCSHLEKSIRGSHNGEPFICRSTHTGIICHVCDTPFTIEEYLAFDSHVRNEILQANSRRRFIKFSKIGIAIVLFVLFMIYIIRLFSH